MNRMSFGSRAARRQQQEGETQGNQQAHAYASIDDDAHHGVTPITAYSSQHPGAHPVTRRARQDLSEEHADSGDGGQDRRQGGEPRPLHRVPDGRGRNPTADDPGDFATYRGAAAAAAVGTGMKRPIFMHQRQPTGGARPNAMQNGQTDPRTACRSLLCRKSPLSRVGTSRQSRKSLQFAPLPSSSGESRSRSARRW
jgi:hypothetical protein